MTLTNGSFDALARANLNAEQLIIYNALNTTYGNRNYLWDVNNVTSGSGGNGMSYEIPPEALQDEEFRPDDSRSRKISGSTLCMGWLLSVRI